MRLVALPLALTALVVFAGCDAFGSDTWHSAGSVATFDYEAGDEPLLNLDGSPVASQPRLLQMRFSAPETCRLGPCVTWAPPDYDPSDILYTYSVTMPLDRKVYRVDDTGLVLDIPTSCPGYLSSEPARTQPSVRVPRGGEDVYELLPCQPLTEPRLALTNKGRESVTTPAGTFEAIVLEGFNVREYWNWEVGLVRVDMISGDGALRGRFVRSAE